jgi:UDP-N-acetylglucosamine--N-acetylmuramyl-(pentapeptide) pyrophosphoryl-undecaprenol N-acetylglucosamine transferase
LARLLYGISPIGLGHATRAIAVGKELAASGLDILFATGGPAAQCLRSSGFQVSDVVTEPVPNVRDGEMKNAALWYFRYWRGFRRTKSELGKLVSSWRPDAIVGDEEFSCVTLALERSIPHALISDELELGFARSWLARKVEARVAEWYSGLQQRTSLLIIPEDGDDQGNKRFVGPIVRNTTRTRAQVIEEFGLPADRRLVVLSLSGTGIGGYLTGIVANAVSSLQNAALVVVGNRAKRLTGNGIFDLGVVTEGQNLVAAADLVVSTAGKSTIDEAASCGTPLIVIPIRNHPEQLRNASALGFQPGDLQRLPELVASLVGKRKRPQEFQGAQRTAAIISSLLHARTFT